MKISPFILFYALLLIFCGYFCLWIIAYSLLGDEILAIIFLPFAFKQAILLHCQKRFWAVVCMAELAALYVIQYQSETGFYPIYLLSFLHPILLSFLHPYYHGKPYQRFISQAQITLLIAVIHCLALSHLFSLPYLFLISLTGSLLLLPSAFLLDHYLFKLNWIPFTANLIHKPIQFRIKYIAIYLLLYTINIYLQLHLPDEFYRFLLFCSAIPVLLLAFYYGWQGALFGTILNNITLIATAHHFSGLGISDLLLSLSAQTIMGILLGLGTAHLQELNQTLSSELNRNKKLTRQLFTKEENIRKDISRELHDVIGQNITAIRTQATILKRLDPNERNQQIASTIEYLSLNIYDTIKQLLKSIRPKELDDLDLKQALEQLFLEFNLEIHQIELVFHWENPMQKKLDHLLEITLYRLCQEGINNIIKHAKANKIQIRIKIRHQISLTIEDNGIGFLQAQTKYGFGLQGMQERIGLLGGSFQLKTQPSGTFIAILLPITHNETDNSR